MARHRRGARLSIRYDHHLSECAMRVVDGNKKKTPDEELAAEVVRAGLLARDWASRAIAAGKEGGGGRAAMLPPHPPPRARPHRGARRGGLGAGVEGGGALEAGDRDQRAVD